MSTEDSLDAYWMPFTANRAFKQHPRMLVSASGMFYRSADGREILDGTSGLWCVNAGHGRREIREAVARSLTELDYAPSFQLGHPAAFELAERLAGLLPAPLSRIFFTNSGSEAVDTALKIALAHFRARGEGGRRRLVGRLRGYHGVGFGGISVGGIAANRDRFEPLLPGAEHLPHTHDLEHQAFSHGQPGWGAHLADGLLALVERHGADSIAAVIVEPVAGSTGVLVPPLGYLERLRQLCTQHGILLIFDEVITAFGRLGAGSAAERFGVLPDLVTLAKGLTNGTVPMGAVGIRDDIYETAVAASPDGIELPHGYTCSGHPTACAAAGAALSIYTAEGLFERAAHLESDFEDALHSLSDTGPVIDVRNFGLMGAVELAAGERPGERGAAVMQACFDSGLLVRVTGDTIALSPPLIAEHEHLERIATTLASVLSRLA